MMFVELHAQSAFSFLEGAEPPEAYVAEAARRQMRALALVDRDGLYGAARFHRAAVAAGITPIIGAEITLADGARLPLLVEDRDGYRNLCRLLTRRHMTDTGLALDDLAPYAEGLVCLTGGSHGPLAAAVRAADADGARGRLDHLVRVFGRSSCFVEVQRHRHRDQERELERLVSLARHAGLPVLAANQPLYCR